jgi:hypothetical protein
VTFTFSYAARDLAAHLRVLPGSIYATWFENWLLPVNLVMLAFLL